QGFPSSIAINNTGTGTGTFALGIYDARNGTKLGNYTTPAIAPNGRAVISVAAMEAAAGITPGDNTFHYTIKAENAFSGFMQHLVDNQYAGVTTDMSTVCAITP